MGGMPDPIEDSTKRGGAAKFFKHVEGWFNDPVNRQANRTAARTKVGAFASISPSSTLSGSKSAGGMQHFNRHWRGGSSGWWPNIPATRINAELGAAFRLAFDTVLAQGNEGMDIRLRWDCRNRNLNAPPDAFRATVHTSGNEVWIDVVSPRAPGGKDPDSGFDNYGFTPTSDLPPGSLGPFTPLGDLEVANYDGVAGIDTSFDNDGGTVVTTEGFRESWSFFPLREPIVNGSQVLTGLSYTRDSWRASGEIEPVEHVELDPDDEHLRLEDEHVLFEEESFHSEIGYLLWDEANGLAYRVIALPRGLSVLAVATDVGANSTELRFEADALANDPFRGGILSNPILSGSVQTVHFASTMRIAGDGSSFEYEDIADQVRKGDEEPVRHTDTNRLERI
jgi:hypothetical protein